jgi:phosphate/sulfate permease
MEIIALHLVVLAIAILDGMNNTANFVSIAMGSRSLSPRNVVVVASLGVYLGVSLFALNIYEKILRFVLDSPKNIDTVSIDTVVLSLVIAIPWFLYASFTKVVTPITIALLGIFVGFSSNSLTDYLSKISTYLALWLLQILISAIITISITKLSRRTGTSTTLCIALAIAMLSYVLLQNVFLVIALTFVISLLIVLVFKRLCVENGYPRGIFEKISIAIPLTTASIAHGMNDGALLLSLTSTVSFSRNNLYLNSLSIGLSMVLGLNLWSIKISESLARTIALTDIETAKNLYVSLFTTTFLFNTIGIPASTTFSTLGTFVGIAISKKLGIVRLKSIAKLILIAVATIAITSIPTLILKNMLHLQ